MAGTLTVLDGLDLVTMGTTDPHRAWGVAAAQVPTAALIAGTRSSQAFVAPAVRWLRIDRMGGGRAAAALGASDEETVAIAITWPVGAPPTAVRLVRLDTATRSPGRAFGEPDIVGAQDVPLGAPVPLLAGLASPGPLDDPGLLNWTPWQRRSGTFFLPDGTLPSTPAGWSGHGWPRGAYEWIVTAGDGSTTVVAFSL